MQKKFKMVFIALLLQSFCAGAFVVDCPKDMALVENFCIDQYEAPNIKGQKPFVGQTASDGHEWCQKQGKRLCNEEEWLKACEGEEKRKFPFGQVWSLNICNDNKSWKAPRWSLIQKYPDALGVREINRLNQVEASGNFSQCVTPEGVYDLGGNTSEWVVKTLPHTTKWKEVLMGCYWSGCYGQDRNKSRSLCRGTNAGHSGERGVFRTYEAGFRCCL